MRRGEGTAPHSCSMMDFLQSVPPYRAAQKSMRPNTHEVLAGLKQYAVGQRSAIRSNALARKLGLPARNVSNALNWLVVDNKYPGVRRERVSKAYWYLYWWEGDANQ